MKRVVKYLLVFIAVCNFLIAQNILKHKLNDVVVTAGRMPISISNIARSVQIITAQEIKLMPVSSISELLKNVVSVDVRQRGADEIQSDISLRGASFEQTLILVDGIKMSDAQTGHHNMNIPVSIDQIERIEILKGQGSKVHGANAFGGVINIITKKTTLNRINLNLSAAQNATYSGTVILNLPFGMFNQNFSVTKKSSNGYKHNTGYNVTGFSYSANYSSSKAVFNFMASYRDKEFGANSFYTSAFPNQWEHVKTTLFSASGEFLFGILQLSAKAYLRKNNDEFLLKYNDPSFYKNNHETNTVGAELQASVKSNLGITSFGAEFSKDKIESSNLGNHDRSKGGFFGEHQFIFENTLFINIGAFLYNYAELGWKLWPGVDVAFKPNKNSKIFASMGKAFRIPTFTELYYLSPASIGNANLSSEETTNIEIGYSFNKANYSASIAEFYRNGKNIIDWVKTDSKNPWKAQNIGSLKTKGIEMNLTLRFSNSIFRSLNVGYTYLDLTKDSESKISKYAFENLKHQLIISSLNNFLFDTVQSLSIRYEKRENFEEQILVDTEISKSFNNYSIYLSVSNIFDASNLDINGIPLRGRWFKSGIKFNLF